jgi:RNA polymerase primary sigma factor
MKPLTINAKVTNRDNDSLKQYFRDIYSYARFTPEEEAECAFKAYNGDEKAMDDLINRNLRFVVSVAKQYETKDAPLGDLINEGNLGLIYAARRFKPDFGFKFISYAVWWIRKYINEFQSNNGRTVRIPINKINHLSKLNQKIATLEQKLSRPVDIQEIKLEFDLSDDDEQIKASKLIGTFNMDSLDRDVSSDNDGSATLGELLADDSIKPTDHLLNTSDMYQNLERMLDTLKPKDKEIISALFGLNGKEPLTLDEVGVMHGNVTKEAIRLAKNRILKKLKATATKYSKSIEMFQ